MFILSLSSLKTLSEIMFPKSFFALVLVVLIISLSQKSFGQSPCRCTPVANCADGTGGIDPRVVNEPNFASCISGERYCCNLIDPTLGSSTVLCGVRRPVTVPNYLAAPGQADFAEYPWLALIYSSNDTYIGAGALIDNQFVITVAHKFYPSPYPAYKIRLGEWILNAETEPLKHVEVGITSIRIHEGYVFTQATNTLLNDIAIIKLASPVNIVGSNHINSACLPTPNRTFTGQTCWVAGFGATAFVNGVYTSAMREVDLPVVDGNACQNTLRTTRLGASFTLNQQQFICAGGQSGKDACAGDGGAPLVCLSDSQWFIAGLVSWGVGCGDPIPGVYVNVANYWAWIAANRI